ncbi:MAG: hypothetical protein RRY54_08640, partial [Angelakisella sp.]
MAHSDELTDEPPTLDYDASLSQKLDDSFAHHYIGAQKDESSAIAATAAQRAYKLQGSKLSEYRLRLIEGSMPVDKLLEIAHQHSTTLTVLLGAVLLEAIHQEMPVRMQHLPVVLSIPVNLRTYFESQSTRNFFGLFYAGYSFEKSSGEFSDILASLSESFRRELTPQRLGTRMNELAALEHNVFTRAIPLFLKDITLKIFGRRSEHQMTAAFSNLGKISMPEPMMGYIDSFIVCSTTDKLQVCLSTFKGRLTVTMTSPFAGSDIEMRFFRELTKLGAEVTINSNYYDAPPLRQ